MLQNTIVRSLIWLAFLGPLFFISYGWSNQYVAGLTDVPTIQFEWEKSIPFMGWTIVPYWTIDLLYGLAFLTCTTILAVDRYALRLLTVQIISIICFVVWPLRFSSIKPEVEGAWKILFDALAQFDMPFNQAPSLHISLLVIIWAQFATRISGWIWWLFCTWMVLIAVSVLTTYQHHFIDVPTGVAAGLFAVWLWPTQRLVEQINHPQRIKIAVLPSDKNRWALCAGYGLAAMTGLILAVYVGWLDGAVFFIYWFVISMLWVSLAYALRSGRVFQKKAGKQSVGSFWLFLPYQCGAWLNAWIWTRRSASVSRITSRIFLCQYPSKWQWRVWQKNTPDAVLIDLCPELSHGCSSQIDNNPSKFSFPWLDLLIPTPFQLYEVVKVIGQLNKASAQPTVYVCCALGYSRSATAVCAWLLYSQQVSSVKDAVNWVSQARPSVVLKAQHLEVLEIFRREFVGNE
jgi:membrane-associated phospholipid phosphatase